MKMSAHQLTSIVNGAKLIFNLIKTMVGEAASRPTISEVLSHPFFKSSPEQGTCFLIYYNLNIRNRISLFL